jgi:polyisoprenoid-binding protein YceI
MPVLGPDNGTLTVKTAKGGAIEFRSTRVDERPGGRLDVEGELDLLGSRRPIAFALNATADGRITGSAVVRQTNWGIKPYSALFGTLKVADDVEVRIDAQLPAGR